MRRFAVSLLAVLLGVAAATALVSCGGGDNSELLPGNTAREITANLDAVKQLASSGDCVGAQNAAQQVSAQIDALGGVDKQLKQALRDGAARLNEVVATCSTATTEGTLPIFPTTTESKPPKEKPKKEKPKKGETTPTIPTTTMPTVPTTPTQTTPTTPTPPIPPAAPPAGGGGTGPPSGGVGPGSASGEGD